ncbi:MAG TPA: hypothetical protein DEB09_05265 [Candidatus Magasanikbacteria bacterium]|nr:hypothetical protein [Candidatus Magasanikbacteria bacterium]
MNYKIILGVVAVIIGIITYIPYIRDVINKKTKPHIFTWFVWSIIVSIAFFAALSKGAGAGAWVLGISALLCAFITVISYFHGDKDYKMIDWICLVISLVGILGWQLTNSPLVAIVMVVIADLLAFIPTVRKGYSKPFEETISTWLLNALKHFIGLLALQAYNLVTCLYPVSLIIGNGLFGVVLIIRRRKLKH